MRTRLPACRAAGFLSRKNEWLHELFSIHASAKLEIGSKVFCERPLWCSRMVLWSIAFEDMVTGGKALKPLTSEESILQLGVSYHVLDSVQHLQDVMHVITFMQPWSRPLHVLGAFIAAMNPQEC